MEARTLIVAILLLSACGGKREGEVVLFVRNSTDSSFSPKAEGECDSTLEINLEIVDQTGVYPLRKWILSSPEGSFVAEKIPPARGYRFTLYFGLAERKPEGGCREVTVVRSYGRSPLFDLAPRERKEMELFLVRCSADEVDGRRCGEFGRKGREISPPVVFPIPSSTGCDRISFAGEKNLGTYLVMRSAVLGNTVSDPVTETTTFRVELPFSQWGVSPGSPVSFVFTSVDWEDKENKKDTDLYQVQYDRSLLCFDPYGERDPRHLEKVSGEYLLRWEYGGTEPTDVGFLESSTTSTLPSSITSPPPRTVSVTSLSYSYSIPSSVVDLGVYLRKGTSWFLVGVFRNDPDWIGEHRPDLK
jgi:hypothetical protein